MEKIPYRKTLPFTKYYESDGEALQLCCKYNSCGLLIKNFE
jgi:hypothetical protein